MAKILLIDDEPTLLKMLSWRLESIGHTIEEADNVDLALEKFTANQPDLIITDIRMPGKDGIYLVNKIKEINSKIPCIIMSGHGDLEAKKTAEDLSGCAFIQKPLNFEKLRVLIQEATE